MTNYNERLGEILNKTPCSQCDGSGAYPDYDGEPVQCQFCWQLRFTFIDNAKQAIASLIKELVIPARSGREYDLADPTGSPLGERVDNRRFKTGGTMDYIDGLNSGYNRAIDEFEQNLLKELEGKG